MGINYLEAQGPSQQTDFTPRGSKTSKKFGTW